ncbi:cytochrome c-type biogenesis protein [Halomonas elongata]|uniref:Cytochrome c-type biogenesis protein n=1 Tax=Halomonas elongata TaxID=2746 RepID=A0A1B8NWS3_HALEL|nr:cytochrome c-type biogenesis protein [Halomonas elongata]MBW5799314.1 cytochrome c-type biogenesis protein CcmH [Halomonas elongata]OBX34466.1 cytochrome c-type biogenesis protein CcmH precursor [Halomonas elongata]WVI70981.1 cytochrome c-type biogenesis protein [Halomonas elongata]
MARVSVWLLILLTALALPALAAVEVRQFDDPVLEQRYHDLTATLRCPKCQNQSIGDSDSPIAGDMRERVYQQLQQGRSDKEILDFMVHRFGDYVLYNPRLEGRTLLLWGLPAALVVLGLVLVILLVRARRHVAARGLSEAERARLDALVNRPGALHDTVHQDAAHHDPAHHERNE